MNPQTDPDLQAKIMEILDSLPPAPPRSRLEPYRELIREMRRRGRTFREIRQVLEERCGVRIAPSSLQEFVHRRSRAKPRPTAGTAQESEVKPATKPGADLRERMEALKQRPAAAVQGKKPVFHYDENEPLRVRGAQSEKASETR